MAKPADIFSVLAPTMRVVVMTGKEPFLLAEGTRRLTTVLTEAFGEIDHWNFDGETATVADVLDELRSYALIQQHKLVVLDRADRFLAGGGRARGGDDNGDGDGDKARQGARRRRAMEAYTQNPTEDATLLMRAETWRRSKLDKLVTVIRCEPLKEAQAIAWCVDECTRRHECAIDQEAARLLVSRVGTGLARLDTELAKLGAFVGSQESITKDDVAELVGRGRQEQAWILQSAIMTGSPENACVKMHELLDVSRHDKALIMWAIGDLLQRLHTAAQLAARRENVHAYRGTLRLYGEDGERMLEVARRASPTRIAQLLQQAVQTDLNNKSGRGDPRRNLEALTMLVTDSIRCL